MSPTLFALSSSSFCTSNPTSGPSITVSRTSTATSDMDRRNLLGSIKNKFSRKGSHALSSQTDCALVGKVAEPVQPRSCTNAPATRRPDRAGMNAFTTPSNEPPPAYTAAPNAAPAPVVTVNHGASARGADDPYAFLTSFDTIFLVDDSGSMAGSRWRETGRALETITPICTSHDADGIDIFFLNHPDSSFCHNVMDAGTVTEIFQTVRPGGGTPTGQRLNQILKPYLAKYKASPDSTKPLNIIVITDGEPSDDVESPIINCAKKLDRMDAPAWQVGIQFFQVGRDADAKKHLVQLDDDLQEISGDDDLRDIVDTVPFKSGTGAELTGDGILKVVLGAVNRRLDRKKSSELHHR
ncbi:hypothetical protein LTR16_000093 [Cryomyces antarcticus]|uniref:VWFA domain-containing protein n=1 Tax=Cryomyces antarcticus TaxID=329879 RepID=A0ABR0KUY4_9PEZI|nr:hypothetical protein LTR39_001993 [Cryomyces antarcticus]KAK5132067.1 hypothetical protein LTR16_000093 [Cryomyces antarcticus]